MATGRYVVEGVGGMTLRRVQEALNEGSDKGWTLFAIDKGDSSGQMILIWDRGPSK